MALKIKFNGGEDLPYLSALETEEYWNGSSRRTLTFQLARDAADLEELDGLCTEQNLAQLELTNDDMGVTNVYEGYVLKLKVGVEPVLAAAETPDTPATYEDRIVLKLGKRTYIEQQLHNLGVN